MYKCIFFSLKSNDVGWVCPTSCLKVTGGLYFFNEKVLFSKLDFRLKDVRDTYCIASPF